VAPSGGSDTTGVVDDDTHPFATIGAAAYAIQVARNAAGRGNNADGGIVRLLAGEHYWKSSYSSDIPVINEWLTVTKDAALTKSDVTIRQDITLGYPLKVGLKLVRAYEVTLKNYSGDTNGVMFPLDHDSALWLDNVDAIGHDRQVRASQVVSDNYEGARYITDTYITQVSYAVQNFELARGVTIETIGWDAYQFVKLIVNCSVDDIYPEDSTWHADMWQWSSGTYDNIIVYNLVGTNLAHNGIINNTSQTGDMASNIAFVNVYIQLNTYFQGNGFLWERPTDHMLIWNVSINWLSTDFYTCGRFSIYANLYGADTQIRNMSFRGNVARAFATSIVAGDVTYTDYEFRTNHFYDALDSRWAFMFTDTTSGDPDWDVNGVPNVDSPLLDRLSSPLVPVDASDPVVSRGSPCDIGAYERP